MLRTGTHSSQRNPPCLSLSEILKEKTWPLRLKPISRSWFQISLLSSQNTLKYQILTPRLRKQIISRNWAQWWTSYTKKQRVISLSHLETLSLFVKNSEAHLELYSLLSRVSFIRTIQRTMKDLWFEAQFHFLDFACSRQLIQESRNWCTYMRWTQMDRCPRWWWLRPQRQNRRWLVYFKKHWQCSLSLKKKLRW